VLPLEARATASASSGSTGEAAKIDS
jgi:hypothetical protein